MSDENIKRPATSASNLASWLDYIGVRTKVKFDGQCLKQDQVIFTYKKIGNMYIVYEAIWRLRQDDDFTWGNALFGVIKLTKNADKDNTYSGHGIGLDNCGTFSLSNGGVFGRNVIILVVDMSSPLHVDPPKKGISILEKIPTDGLDDRRLNVEKEYWINFTEHNKKFCLSLHYNGKNSYIFVNGADIHIIKGKDS